MSLKIKKKFKFFFEINTRWSDNDVYHHVNNVVYYSYFDTAVNNFLIEKKVLDISNGKIIGLVVETKCNYYHPVAFPDKLTVGFSVKKIGNSSVIYNLGIFKKTKLLPKAILFMFTLTEKPVNPQRLILNFVISYKKYMCNENFILGINFE